MCGVTGHDAAADFAFGAENVECCFLTLGIGVCRAFELAVAAVVQPQHAHAEIFGFHLMGQPVNPAADRDHRTAEQPGHQVKGMNALIHQRAAVLRPGAAPGGLIVIGLIVAPANFDVAHQDAAENAAAQVLFDRLH